MGELMEKIKQPPEGFPAYLHRDMVLIEDNAVFTIVHIGRVLHEPWFSAEIQGD